MYWTVQNARKIGYKAGRINLGEDFHVTDKMMENSPFAQLLVRKSDMKVVCSNLKANRIFSPLPLHVSSESESSDEKKSSAKSSSMYRKSSTIETVTSE